MTTDEMVSVIEDVIDANIAYAPADRPEEEIGEWVEREGWPIYHVHGDDLEVVNVFAGGTWLFECTRAQYQEVMHRVSEDGNGGGVMNPARPMTRSAHPGNHTYASRSRLLFNEPAVPERTEGAGLR